MAGVAGVAGTAAGAAGRAWQKSPVWLAPVFDAALPDDPSVQHEKMLGYPGAGVGGLAAAGVPRLT